MENRLPGSRKTVFGSVQERIIHIQIRSGEAAVELAHGALIEFGSAFVRNRAIIVHSVRTGEAAGNDGIALNGETAVFLLFQDNLRDGSVTVAGRGVSAEAPVAETVENISAVYSSMRCSTWGWVPQTICAPASMAIWANAS